MFFCEVTRCIGYIESALSKVAHQNNLAELKEDNSGDWEIYKYVLCKSSRRIDGSYPHTSETIIVEKISAVTLFFHDNAWLKRRSCLPLFV